MFSQGFNNAEQLSGKIVSLFQLCKGQLSSQPHYDFGLRALKSVLNSAGTLKRKAIKSDKARANSLEQEKNMILRSFCDTVMPKLIQQDTPLLFSLIEGVFPGTKIKDMEDVPLKQAIKQQCQERNLLMAPAFY